MIKRNQKGFTLIELMIVIAIIGILAAIAIPQFAAYRIRGFNASAQSDVRNLSTAEAAYYSDWQAFGKSSGTETTGGDSDGALLTGPADGTNAFITGTTPQGDNVGTGIGLGNLVSAVVSTTTGGVSFTAATKHLNGDTPYGVDSDSTAIFNAPQALLPGTPLAAGDEPTPLNANNDFVTFVEADGSTPAGYTGTEIGDGAWAAR